MNIVVLDGFTLNPGDNSWQEVEQLGTLVVYERTIDSQIVSRAKPAEIVLTNKTPLTGNTLPQLPNLKFISVLATGFNVVDIEAARRLQIPVANVPVYGTNSVAQHVFATLLSFIHRPLAHDSAIRRGEWEARGDFSFCLNTLTELSGLTIGIVGWGRIGSRVGELAHAFGMHVLAYNPRKKARPDLQRFSWSSLESLFRQADIVSLHCPLTTDNRGMISKELLSKMKKSAILINASRGGLIEDADLVDALNNGDIGGACLDVFNQEPLPASHPLLNAPNLLLTPHNAWATLAARRRLMATTAENIRGFLSGHPINIVN